ncbi:unnamed protein product, partial [marine sediment metagenome]
MTETYSLAETNIRETPTREKTVKSEKKDEFKTYLEGIETPVMAIDRDFNVTYMNPNGARLLGYSAEETVGKKCYNLFKTDDCQTDKCACAQAMRTNMAVTSETIARAGGGELPIQYTGAPLRSEDGRVIGAVEFVNDITNLKTTMDASAKLVTYLEGIETPIMAIDREFNVTYMNPNGAKLLGLT